MRPSRIVVGISGSVAAYKSVSLIRLLTEAGHDVHVIPTESALRFVGVPTLEAISRNPVTASVYDDVAAVRHVALGQTAEMVVVAPATAHTIAKLAHGLADDLLGTTVLATTAPLVIAPSMHPEMWRNAATQANVSLLRERGAIFVGPDSGRLTGVDSGLGRMSEPSEIAEAVYCLFDAKEEETSLDLRGTRILISAGGTREPLDPVRFIGNRSSGKQGLALAASAVRNGASVTLVAANLDEFEVHPLLDVIRVHTAKELGKAMSATADHADIVIMAAAVADYRPGFVSESKLKKDQTGEKLVVELLENPDILKDLTRKRRCGQSVVGFAAETSTSREELLTLGATKAIRKQTDLLVVNSVGWSSGFESESNSVLILRFDGSLAAEASGTKADIADVILSTVVEHRRGGV